MKLPAFPLLVALSAIACGPSVSVNPDAQPTPDSGAADSGIPDAGPPRPDAAPVVVQMYVHTADTLYTMDDQNFDLTTIGTFDNGDDITDFAVTPDGTLYGISNTALYTVDRVTAAATYVADVPGVSNVGLTFLPDGTLLATDKSGGVRRVNPGTGVVTEVGTFGGGYATAGDLVAVADGTMYAISDDGPNGDEYDHNVLLTVDTSTGVASLVGQMQYGGVFGCAYANGHVYAFTRTGEVIEIDRTTGAGTLVRTHAGIAFWGAGVTPLVVVD